MAIHQLHECHWVDTLPEEVKNIPGHSQDWSLVTSLGPSDSESSTEQDHEEDQEAKEAEVDVISIF